MLSTKLNSPDHNPGQQYQQLHFYLVEVIGTDSLRLVHLGARFFFLWQAMKMSRKSFLVNPAPLIRYLRQMKPDR